MVHFCKYDGPQSPTHQSTFADSSAFGEQPEYMEAPAGDGYKNDLDVLSDAIDMLMQGEERRLDDILDATPAVRPTVNKVKEYA